MAASDNGIWTAHAVDDLPDDGIDRNEVQVAIREVQAVGTLLERALDRAPTDEDWLGILARIGRHQAALGRALGNASTAMGLPAGARDRILLYLLAHVGEPVEKEELDLGFN